MKYLIILSLLLLVAGLFYWRMRPYFLVARRVFGAIRDMRRVSVNLNGNPSDMPRARAAERPQVSNERLIRCTTCGTWTPAARAVALRSTNSFYCSHDCLERAADAPRRTHKSAS